MINSHNEEQNKDEIVTVSDLVMRLLTYDQGLRINLNFDNENFSIEDICQDDDILDIFPNDIKGEKDELR